MDKAIVERFVLALIVAGSLAIGFILRSPREAPAPADRPSIPSLIPPKCDGPCCTCRPQSMKPFAVVCPYCRNRLVATPPQAGEVGEVAKDEARPK